MRKNLDVSQAAMASHCLFTSRSAVHYWTYPIKGVVIALGNATAAALKERGIEAKVAPHPTQEGVVELLETLKLSYLFWPRSSLARPVIEEYVKKKGIPFCFVDLYETIPQRPEPLPDLNDFDEIVFTSPSTVDAFLQIFGSIPRDKKLTAIGSVTESSLNLYRRPN